MKTITAKKATKPKPKTMEVVINRSFGGFGLSDKAIHRCIELGMKVTEYTADGNYADETANFVKDEEQKIYIMHRENLKFRTHPTIVKVVKELGIAANGTYAKLAIVKIPFSTTKGWYIEEYDGNEYIAENHRRW